MPFNDNAVWYGTRHIDFYAPTVPGPPGTASSYAGAVKNSTNVCENCAVTRAAAVQKQYNEVRLPTGSFATDEFDEGSCVVQVPDPTKPIQRYMGFTILFDNTNRESFWVTSVGQPEAQGDFRKYPISFQKMYNIPNPPPITV